MSKLKDIHKKVIEQRDKLQVKFDKVKITNVDSDIHFSRGMLYSLECILQNIEDIIYLDNEDTQQQ